MYKADIYVVTDHYHVIPLNILGGYTCNEYSPNPKSYSFYVWTEIPEKVKQKTPSLYTTYQYIWKDYYERMSNTELGFNNVFTYESDALFRKKKLLEQDLENCEKEYRDLKNKIGANDLEICQVLIDETAGITK